MLFDKFFKAKGGNIAEGAVEKLPDLIGKIWNGLGEGIQKTPLIRVIPYAMGWWDTLSEEDKAKYTAVVMKAAMKAMEGYANS